MKITHIWQDYSPNLFDRAHPLCLSHGLDSEVVCQAFIDNGAVPFPATSFVRTRNAAESNSRSLGRSMIRRLRRPMDTARFARLVAERTQAFRPDVLHVHFGTTAATLERCGVLPNVPMVVSFYGVDASAALRQPATIRLYREMGARGVLAHVLCQMVADRLVGIGWPKDHIEIHNLPARVEGVPKIGLRNGTGLRLLIPARFVEKKGHSILLDALRRVRPVFPDVSLTCFGYGSPDWLVRKIADLRLTDCVRVIDNGQSSSFFDDYMMLLRDHDLVLAPSITSSKGDDEGGPALTVVMAQAAGKPVIVSDFPGAERSVTNGVEGFVTPCGDVRFLAQAILDMAEAPQSWGAMGAAGRARALAGFAEDTYWSRLHALYSRAAPAAT